MFSVNALSMAYGDRVLFRDVTLHFNIDPSASI